MIASDLTVEDLMNASGVAFGTSGARGLVTAMTDRVCHGYTTGFLQFLIEDGAFAPGGRVALAGDLRPSTPRILAACAQAVRDLGCEPVFCGYLPTPALAHWAFAQGVPSIMVTGSHIPDDRNGIKFYRPDGEILKDDERRIAEQVIRSDTTKWDASGASINVPVLPEPIDVGPGYVARYKDFFGGEALSGLRLGVYQHSAVGRDILVEILSALGAEVILLGRSSTFIPVDTEAVRPEDIGYARKWSSEHGLDAIASTDGDSDRPMLADQSGEWIRGDILGVLCAKFIGAESVVTPVSSNSVVDKCGLFPKVQRTRIGSPYVIQGMSEALSEARGVVCGYEANGGFLLANDVERGGRFLKALPTRDAVLPIVAALLEARPANLGDLVASLPGRFTFSDRLKDFAGTSREALMAWLRGASSTKQNPAPATEFADIAGAPIQSTCLLDGVRMTFANERVIHLRGSGNAPELRCYTEAETPEIASGINGEALKLVARRFPSP